MSNMTQQELIEFNKNRKMFQFCVVTDDLDKAVKEWVDLYKVGPWTIMCFNNDSLSDFYVGGKLVEEPFEFHIGISQIGDIQIEIIQPVKGPNIYFDYLKRHGNSLHHMKEYFPDLDELKKEIDRYAGFGVNVTQTGWFAGQDVHYYLDTEERTGMIMELGNCPEIEMAAGSYRMYPEE